MYMSAEGGSIRPRAPSTSGLDLFAGFEIVYSHIGEGEIFLCRISIIANGGISANGIS